MKIAIIGSRDYPFLDEVTDFVNRLHPSTVVVSGGARGVDQRAIQAAQLRGMRVCTYPPRYDLHGKRAPLVRDEQMVDDSDMVVAFWNGKSSGTGYTISYAKKQGKNPHVIFAGGS